MSQSPPEFGNELRRWRESAGMSLASLGAASHFTKGYLSKVENGKVRANRRLAEICDKVLGANGALLALVGSPPEPPKRRVGGLVGLPDVGRHFVGREAERDRVLDVLLGSERIRVCAVSGMPGVGKTALALACAQAAEHDFPDGCLFFDLHGHTQGIPAVTGSEALKRLLAVLDVPSDRIPDDLDGRANVYRDRLRGKRMLLVFDNVADTRQVLPLLPAERRCRVLITSRNRLNALDEAEYVPVDVLTADEATGLFRALAGNHVVAQPQEIATIVRYCGRLPLAIRIAAARFAGEPGLTATEFGEWLAGETSRLDALDDGERSVAAALSLSYQHLAPEPQRVFSLLALYPGTEVELGSVMALANLDRGKTSWVVARLHDAHLLTQRTSDHVELHNLVRAFGLRDALPTVPLPEQNAALRRLVDHTLFRVRTADELIEPGRFRPELSLPDLTPTTRDFADRQGALFWLREALPNLVALCELARARGMHERCWQLALLLRGFLFLDKQTTAWIDTHRAALAAARAAHDAHIEAVLLNNLGMANLELGDVHEAASCYEQALASFTERGDTDGATDALANLGWANLYLGDHEAALTHLIPALDTYRHAGRGRNEMITLRGIALAMAAGGRYADALPFATEAQDRAQEPHDVVLSINCVAWIHYLAGHLSVAGQLYAQSLALGEQNGFHHEAARAMTGLANIAAALGDHATAKTIWNEADDLSKSLNPLLTGEARARAERSGN